MARTNIDIDEDACQIVMERYHLSTKRDAVNFACERSQKNRSALRRRAAFGAQGGRAISTRCGPVGCRDPY